MLLDFFSLTLVAQVHPFFAQLQGTDMDRLEEASMVFSGPQFFAALLSGLVLAFGFQMLLTNLSVATGISYLSHRHQGGSSDGGMSMAKKITLGFGFWTIVTVSLALFSACLLAIRLSLFSSPLLGAITGLVIWGTYFSLLLWLSSTTVGSLVGSVINSATSGLQALIGTATAALGAKSVSNQMVATAEATVAAIRRELASGFDAEDIQDKLRNYVASLRSPQLDVESLEGEMKRLVSESDLFSLGENHDLEDMVDRQSFVELVESRADLSRQDARRIGDRLYRIWCDGLREQQGKNALGEFVSYLKSGKPEELLSEALGDRLDKLIQELRLNRKQGRHGDSPSLFSQAFSIAASIVMGRSDLSDFDLHAILEQLNRSRRELMDQAQLMSANLADKALPYNATCFDMEDFLLHAYPWQLKHDSLDDRFRKVLFDAEADPTLLRDNLKRINPKQFRKVLATRGLFTQQEIYDISLRLELIYQQVLADVICLAEVQASKRLYRRLEIFFQQTPREELYSELGERAFVALIDDEEADAEQLRQRYNSVDLPWIAQFLGTRDDLSQAEAHDLAQRFVQVKSRKLADAESLEASATERLDQQWQQLQAYLRHTAKAALTPGEIKRELSIILEEPEVALQQVRRRLATFDRKSLTAMMAQRSELSQAEVESIVDEVESNWISLIEAPQDAVSQTKAKVHQSYADAKQALENYLRNTGRAELNPDGIKRDLQKLLDDPKQGTKALRDRLSRMDRDTLVQLLSQRDDLSQAEVERAIDDIQQATQDLIRAPRHLARRISSQVQSFETGLEDYLRNTGKQALQPEFIKRDLRILMNDPRLGVGLLSERLSHLDRSHVVALLAQRQDMTEQEAEAVVEQVLAVRDQALAQVKAVRHRLQSIVNHILHRIRNYLNSLERPELNYEGISRDLHQLMDDPQSGFESLRDRLGQFDRNTVVAIMSSSDSLSRMDAERLVSQVEQTRDMVLGRAERLEHKLEGRLNSMKLQAQQQFEETQQAAEAAAWWLFATALISGISAAIGGGLAAAG